MKSRTNTLMLLLCSSVKRVKALLLVQPGYVSRAGRHSIRLINSIYFLWLLLALSLIVTTSLAVSFSPVWNPFHFSDTTRAIVIETTIRILGICFVLLTLKTILFFRVESPLLRVNEIQDISSFISKLANEQNPLSVYLLNQLPSVLQCAVKNQQESKAMERDLVRALNRVLGTQPLYDKKRFAQTKLSQETRLMTSLYLKGKALTRFNRQLLAEAYPQEILPYSISTDTRGYIKENTNYSVITQMEQPIIGDKDTCSEHPTCEIPANTGHTTDYLDVNRLVTRLGQFKQGGTDGELRQKVLHWAFSETLFLQKNPRACEYSPQGMDLWQSLLKEIETRQFGKISGLKDTLNYEQAKHLLELLVDACQQVQANIEEPNDKRDSRRPVLYDAVEGWAVNFVQRHRQLIAAGRSIEDRNHKLVREIEDLKKVQIQLSTERDHLNTTNDGLETEIKLLKHSVKEFESELTNSKQRNRELCEKWNNERGQLVDRVNTLENTVKDYSKQLGQENVTVEKLRDQIREYEKEMRNLENQVCHLETAKGQTEQQYAKLMDEVEHLTPVLTHLSSATAELQELDSYLKASQRNVLTSWGDEDAAGIVAFLLNYAVAQLNLACAARYAAAHKPTSKERDDFLRVQDMRRAVMLYNIQSIAEKLQKIQGFTKLLETVQRIEPSTPDIVKRLPPSGQDHWEAQLFQRLLERLRTLKKVNLAPFYDVDTEGNLHSSQ